MAAGVDVNNFFIHMLSLLEEEMYSNQFIQENPDVLNIRDNLRIFLTNNCEHELVTDSIDLTHEQTKKIVYCTKCMMTL